MSSSTRAIDRPPRDHPVTSRAVSARPVPRGRAGAGSSWAAPVALVLLSIIPVVAGTLRVLEVAGGPQLLPANPRIDASPVPVVVHVISSGVFALLGAFQFSARLRRRRPSRHRRAGRVLVVAGLGVAGSGLWMTLFYTGAPGGDLLWTVRVVVATAMAAAVVLGFAAIRHRDIVAHRAWMIRAYALALGAGTQAFTQGVGEALLGTSELSTAVSVSSGWFINLAVAEWIIRRGTGRRPGRAGTRPARAVPR